METKEIKPKKTKLTKKQRGFVKDYIQTENGTQAALKNYDVKDPKVAAVIATENLIKPNIINAIETERISLKSALISKGIDENKIAEKIEVLLEAKEPIYKNNNETGEIEHVGDKIDYIAVDKGLKHATAIFGIKPEDAPKTASNITYNFLFSSETQESIKAINKTIKDKLIHA